MKLKIEILVDLKSPLKDVNNHYLPLKSKLFKIIRKYINSLPDDEFKKEEKISFTFTTPDLKPNID